MKTVVNESADLPQLGAVSTYDAESMSARYESSDDASVTRASAVCSHRRLCPSLSQSAAVQPTSRETDEEAMTSESLLPAPPAPAETDVLR